MMNDIQLSFETHEDLAVCMCEMAVDANSIVYAVVFYEDAKQLLQMLGSIEEVDFGNIELIILNGMGTTRNTMSA